MSLRIVFVFVLAVVITAVLGTIMQTQINLSELVDMGVSVPVDVRVQTTSDDLLGFTPTLAGIAFVALLLAFPVAALVSRRVPRLRTALYAVAGGVGLYAAFLIVDGFAPMPTLIAATRHLTGALLVAASGLFGGALFARFTRVGQGVGTPTKKGY